MKRWLLWLLLGGMAWAQHADPREALSQAKAEERGVLDQLNNIDRDLMGVRKQLDGLTAQFRELEDHKITLEDEVASAEAVADQHRGHIKRRLSVLYKIKRRGLARLVFGAEDTTQLRRRANYLMRIVRSDQQRLATFAGAKRDHRKATAEFDQNEEGLRALRTQLQVQEAELKDQRSRRLRLIEDIRTRKGLALRAMSEQATAQRELGQFLQATGQPEAKTGRFRDQFGRMPWPTSGRLVRKMGRYKDPLTGQDRESLGIDIAASFGTPFRAIFPGRVTLVDFIPGYGQTVAVEHGPYTTVYGHANGVQVRRGQSVQAGDVLGNVGNSGLASSDSTLLTFEIRYNNTPQDPLKWLSARGGG